jgi:PTH1 family peptidyl-tRNA hydrolase
MKWIIVGLGNPGGEYANTRHNVGKMVLSSLFDAYAEEAWKEHKPWKAIATKGSVVGADILLVAPLVYMNESGKSLVPLVKSKKQASQTVIIHDDIDLPLGTWKFAFERGSGGHNGVESVMKTIKTKAFVRIRVGVLPLTPGGKPKKPKGEDRVVKFVLGKFAETEREEVRRVAKEIVSALPVLCTEGLEKAMSRYN